MKLFKTTLAATSALLLAAAAQAQITVSSTNSVSEIFDNSSGTRAISFLAGDITPAGSAILDVNVSLRFAKADGEGVDLGSGTPFFNEVEFTLTYGSTTVALISPGSFSSGDAGTWFNGTITFDDAAASVVNVNTNLITAGTFSPIGSLSDFNGLAFNPGDWTLSITDSVGADALRFYEATVSVTYAGEGTSAVPEPSTYGLIGMALLGGVIARRRLATKKAA